MSRSKSSASTRTAASRASATTPQRVHPLLWVIEPLELHEPTLEVRPMFGGKAIYVRGRFVLFLAAKEEPWSGVLVPTEREHQPSLIQDLPDLKQHPVLPKWLYLSQDVDQFEGLAAWLVARIRCGDERIGIEPAPRKASPRSSKKRPAHPEPGRAPQRRDTP